MKYVIDQEFRCESVERFRDVYFSEDFNDRVAREIGLKERRLVEEKALDDGRVLRRVRMVPSVQLPAALKKLIGDHEISYDEVSTFDPAKNELEYFIDSKAKDRVSVTGTIRFLPSSGGVRRVIDCEVSAKVFGLGGVIERLIESEVKKGYEQIARIMQRYLDEGAAATS